MWVRFLLAACYNFFVDPEVDELKELVRTNIKLSQDTNRLLHGMRRAAWWGRVFRLLWWVAILGLSGALYFYFFAPYVEKIVQFYSGAQNILENFRPSQ